MALKKDLEERKKAVLEAEKDRIFIPSWKQIRAKILVHQHIANNHIQGAPSDITYRALEKISSYGKSTWQLWFKKEGFSIFFDEKDDFIEQVDKGAYRVLKRLEELAFNESGNAAVSACRAYLALSSFGKSKVSLEIEDLNKLSEKEIDAEIKELQLKLKR